MSPSLSCGSHRWGQSSLQKTKMCKHFAQGSCKWRNCNFAHSEAELRGRPNLSKTKFCERFLAKGRCDQPGCRYAHNAEEYRKTPVVPGGGEESHAANPANEEVIPASSTAAADRHADSGSPASTQLRPRSAAAPSTAPFTATPTTTELRPRNFAAASTAPFTPTAYTMAGTYVQQDVGVFVPNFGLVVTLRDIELLLVSALPVCYED